MGQVPERRKKTKKGQVSTMRTGVCFGEIMMLINGHTKVKLT